MKLTNDSDGWIEFSVWTKGVLDINLGERFVWVGVIGRSLNSSPHSNGDIPTNHTVQHTAVVLQW